MNKSCSKSDKNSIEKLIDRLISKFKLSKRGSQPATSAHRMEVSEERIDCDTVPVTTKNRINHEEMDDSENRKISLRDLPIFCEKLENFIKYIRNIEDLQYLTYDYPEIVRNRFENDVLELECMLREINAAVTNINRQKVQQSFIKKEKTSIKKVLNRIKDSESREMENVVALYDKTLFSRWESAKTTRKPEVLKTLLTDIKCKQLALENLNSLVTRRLENLKGFASLIGSRVKKDDKENSIIALPFVPFCPIPNERKSKIPLPPPLPPPPTIISTNRTQSLSERRRRRIDMEDINWDNIYSLASDIDAIDLPVIPLTFNDVPDNFLDNFNGNLHLELESHIPNSGPESQGGLTIDLYEEMQTVRNALFGNSNGPSENHGPSSE